MIPADAYQNGNNQQDKKPRKQILVGMEGHATAH